MKKIIAISCAFGIMVGGTIGGNAKPTHAISFNDEVVEVELGVTGHMLECVDSWNEQGYRWTFDEISSVDTTYPARKAHWSLSTSGSWFELPTWGKLDVWFGGTLQEGFDEISRVWVEDMGGSCQWI